MALRLEKGLSSVTKTKNIFETERRLRDMNVHKQIFV